MTRRVATSRESAPARRRAGRVPARATTGRRNGARDDVWRLRLYVAGQTPKSVAALRNLRQLCEEHLDGRYEVEVVDLAKHPELAAQDQILAIPTLVRQLPKPLKKIIGDLSRTERVLVGFDIAPDGAAPR